MKILLVVSKVSFKKRMVNKRKTIFININGSREDVPEELAHLLDYLKTKTPTDGFTERLEQRVLKIRRDTEWRDDYMTLEMKMDEKYEQGREQGLKEGIQQGIELGIGHGLRVQIQKKLNKGKSISQIADECEESEDTIRKIISEKGISEQKMLDKRVKTRYDNRVSAKNTYSQGHSSSVE